MQRVQATSLPQERVSSLPEGTEYLYGQKEVQEPKVRSWEKLKPEIKYSMLSLLNGAAILTMKQLAK